MTTQILNIGIQAEEVEQLWFFFFFEWDMNCEDALRSWSPGHFIHLIPEWRKIHYSFVSTLIGPCWLVLSQIFL